MHRLPIKPPTVKPRWVSIFLAWVYLVSGEVLAADTVSSVTLRQCDGKDLGDRILCHVMNASMMSSHAVWERIAQHLPSILGLIFAFQVMKILWNWDPSTILVNLARVIARSLFGVFVITSSSSYLQFYELYGRVESAALSLVTGFDGVTAGGSRSGGSPQMGSLTGVILNIPDSLHGGMTLKKQSGGEGVYELMDCPDYANAAYLPLLSSLFQDNTAIGMAGMRCIAESLSAHAFEGTAEAKAFVLKLSELTARSTTPGGVASTRYGNTDKQELITMLNSNDRNVSVPEMRKIEDTLFVWKNMDELLNIACGVHRCSDPTTTATTADSQLSPSKLSGSFGSAVTATATAGLVPWIESFIVGRIQFFKAYLMFVGLSYTYAWPYYLLLLASWGVWLLLTVAYFRLAVIPAIVIPFVLVFYTAWWVAAPIENQIGTMIQTYKDKIIKYALGPAVVVLLSSVALSLMQGVVAIFSQGMK